MEGGRLNPGDAVPMWIFRIKAGELQHDGAFFATAYSGWDDGDGVPEQGEGKNDPTKVTERGIGPLPPGRYRIRGAEKHPTAGNWVMRLDPLEGTNTFGRSGFLIHGDSRSNPGAGSHGCIVTALQARKVIAAFVAEGDNLIDVTP